MYIPPKIWVFYLIVFVGSAFGDFQPIAIPIRDFPSDAGKVVAFVRDDSGWTVAELRRRKVFRSDHVQYLSG